MTWTPINWPGAHIVRDLVKMASGLFIWAQSIMDYLQMHDNNYEVVLEQILLGKLSQGSRSLDSLYIQVLLEVIPEKSAHYMAWKLLIKDILGIIIAAKVPVEQSDLIYLMGEDESEMLKAKVAHAILKLSPVLSVRPETQKIILKHLSFSEFLMNSEKCIDVDFFIDSIKYTQIIGINSLNVMLKSLKFNMYNFPSSYERNDDVKQQLLSKVHNYIAYSCIYWVEHVLDMDLERDNMVVESVKLFLYKKLLYWLEVLSMQKVLNIVPIFFRKLADKMKNIDYTLAVDLEDTAIFVMKYFTPISESIPHIYLSVLPFAPKYSYIRREYLHLYTNILQVQTGLEEKENPLLITMKEQSRILSVAISPNGNQLITGSCDNTIKIWDVQMQQVVASPLQGHSNYVTSVAFSPDGKKIVSGSGDMTVQIWNTDTGKIFTGPLRGHTNWVRSVAFSSNGKLVVSGSDDKTIKIWNIYIDQQAINSLEGHTDYVTSVTFSPNGKYIAQVQRIKL
ncbi:hypothetical protein BDQ17DRAFT_245186 [Cyathus striatus]|nr:hypothetical protein BDQ17DRAFT_245186 [Cyathus striatus]